MLLWAGGLAKNEEEEKSANALTCKERTLNFNRQILYIGNEKFIQKKWHSQLSTYKTKNARHIKMSITIIDDSDVIVSRHKNFKAYR